MAIIGSEPDFAVQLREDLPESDVRHVLEIFAVDLDRLLEVIAVAAKDGNAPTMRTAAHALAGASGAVGAFLLCGACRAAMADRESDVNSLQAHRTAIETASRHTRMALTRVIGK